ncbi:histidine phosphatase family protein [Rubrimonas cliftonensis]|uniref:Histidine phosphatase superfamily (Branch 1) n=1 Tax=Rubrimonas cliftonensis TaxID=89524 RepID=A0A1H4D8N7_9RHOB|nr:histidine phosphatase family protein [Rubrimonas cliftonensis]SEA69074.1 Histidine phosphatase superfamily (branch 1) [Rubrimonas cliftonensis]
MRLPIIAGLLIATLATCAARAMTAEERAVLARLGEPGVHAVMRHALAPGYSDPADFRLDDCATQRNLDAAGRAQAQAAGDMLRAAGARIDRVLSSQWCRCLETARLMALGAVEEAPPLNSFFEARSRRAAQTEATRALVAGLPEGATALLVTHQVNVAALVGGGVRSGEIVVFRLGVDGEAEVLGRVTPPAG